MKKTRRGSVSARILLTALAGCVSAGGLGQDAWAGEVYRCGPQGRVFSQTPCPEGGQAMKVDGEVSGRRQAEALEVARREAALARAMSRKSRSGARAADHAAGGTSEPERPSEAGRGATILPMHPLSVGASRPESEPRVLKPQRARRAARAAERGGADFVARVPKPAASR